MSNIFFQGAEVWVSSGSEGSSYMRLPRVQGIGAGFQIPRVTIPVMGRFKPLAERPVINFTPVPLSIEYIKGDKAFEDNLGLTNATGVGVALGAADSNSVAGFGCRNFQIRLAPHTSPNYAGQINVLSGVLTSFSLGGSIGDPVKGAVAFECLDWQQVTNTGVRSDITYSANLIKSENIILSGIGFSGLGITNLIIQNFKLDVTFGRVATIRMGNKYPERPITDVHANLSIQGFLEGINTDITSLTGYDCGTALANPIQLTLSPSCSSEAATVITMTNPYLDSQQFGAQVGNFISVDMSFSCPISTIATEAQTGSNLTIV